jgi:hypothetical protein
MQVKIGKNRQQTGRLKIWKEFIYLGTTARNEGTIQEEIKLN